MELLVTGGAGFVGATVAVELATRHPDWDVVAFDSLHRRGSELNLPRLRAAGVRFRHGDVRSAEDVLGLGRPDAIVECSAEPSVLAGLGGSPDHLVRTNLLGAFHCLELARLSGAQLVFPSTSRVYPVARLASARLDEAETRFELAADQPEAGISPRGVSEACSLEGARTLYGASKLAGEHLITEYAAAYGVATVVDRCGVIAGPWQMGRVDQGVFTHWVLSHHLGRPLEYIGHGGLGKQVRDLLHVDDLVDLLETQLADPGHWAGRTVNVGGGRPISLSLQEATALCREITGREVAIVAVGEDRPGDVPLYLSDTSRLEALTDWRPRRDARRILEDIHAWIVEHEAELRAALG